MPSYTCRILVLSVCKINVFLNFTGNDLVVGEGASHFACDERSLGREPSQGLSIQASSCCPLQELLIKEVSGGRPLQELSNDSENKWWLPPVNAKEVSGGRPLQELSVTMEVSSGCPLQLWLNQEATPWINPSQIPLMERSPSQPESQQRLAGEHIKFSHF